MADLRYILPQWRAPAGVRALATTRIGGVSPAPWNSFNLGVNTADSPDCVEANRSILREILPPQVQIQWMQQVHGGDSLLVRGPPDQERLPQVDALVTSCRNLACVVLTADCLPILVCDRFGDEVAAIHAGWRGLCAGVIESALAQMQAATSDLHVWIGPAIGGDAFEVGEEVLQRFLSSHLIEPNMVGSFCRPHPNRQGKYLIDLAGVAAHQLRRCGVAHVTQSELCTFTDPARFYSYRRDGETGRMAALIWIDKD